MTSLTLTTVQLDALRDVLAFAAPALASQAAANERHLERLVERFQFGDPYLAIPEATARQRELEALLRQLAEIRATLRHAVPAPSRHPGDMPPWMAGMPLELD